MDRRRRGLVSKEGTNGDHGDGGTASKKEESSSDIKKGQQLLSKKRRANRVEVEEMDEQEEPVALEKADTVVSRFY